MAAADDAVSIFNDIAHPQNSRMWWMLVHFEGNAEQPTVFASGDNGFNHMKAALVDDKILHGAFKVLSVDNRGNVVAVRSKVVAFTYVGSGVGALKKGQAGPQRERLKRVFQGVSLELQVDDPSDLSPEGVASRLLASGGAHKPTKYQFGPDEQADSVTIEQLIGQSHT
eukprot:TRINITY_DN1702_c0_g1_i1.p1 TRINITY_DN1702_c0_g1~~TRINITY_DN1702_c0_g1_i1.p1  ORF type:complete len:169 (-),score=68.35 TRINITY_DN1702_c0_g1_i1:123-629(-)